jgi:hypothetical protein
MLSFDNISTLAQAWKGRPIKPRLSLGTREELQRDALLEVHILDGLIGLRLVRCNIVYIVFPIHAFTTLMIGEGL